MNCGHMSCLQFDQQKEITNSYRCKKQTNKQCKRSSKENVNMYGGNISRVACSLINE